MCTEVVVIRGSDRQYCDTVKQLAKALGVKQSRVSADGWDFCLCNARLDELGARQATEEEGWPSPMFVIESPIKAAP